MCVCVCARSSHPCAYPEFEHDLLIFSVDKDMEEMQRHMRNLEEKLKLKGVSFLLLSRGHKTQLLRR